MAGFPRTCVALDLRGHGASSHTDEYSFESMASDVLDFLRVRNLSAVDLIGHSLGGSVAQHVAMRAPAKIRRMVIEDAPPPPVEWLEPLPAPPERPPEPVDFDWAVVAPIFTQVRTQDPTWWERLPAVTTPTLWLAGGPTSHVDQSRIAAAAAAMPTATLTEIPAGHHIHRESPTEFATVVGEFLN
jgi:pimeloyl-ACP methyl ester carboxylesterase